MRATRLLPLLALLALTAAVPFAEVLFAQPKDPPARKPRKVALLVGPSTYLHDFDKLNYTAQDVEALAAVLRDNGFDEVVVLTDPPEGKNPATRQNVLDKLEKLVTKQPEPANNIRKGDVVLVILSGHGLERDLPDPAQPGKTKRQAFFAPVDGKQEKTDTLLSIDHLVNDVLVPCGGRNLLVVDACRDIYDPKKGKGIGGKSVSLNGESAVLFSCSSGELSFESKDVQHGVFTHAVLEVMKDTREAGKPLTWTGLVAKLEEKMSEDAVKKLIPAGKTQTPVLAAGQVPTTELLAVRSIAEITRDEDFEYVIEGEKRTAKRQVLVMSIGGGEKMEFVRIKAGTFQMGAPGGEKESEDNEKPQRKVEITKDFYLGKYEVTQGQYKAVTGESPSGFKGDRLPVETVSWDDTEKFCEALSKKVKRAAGLPSEAQWEYACRAGTTTSFHFGAKLNGDLANCDGNYPYGTDVKGTYKGKTVAVGSYAANPWGLHDMHGNVWEWCRDYYGPYDKVVGLKDPLQLNKQSEDSRVLRGGSWNDFAKYCRGALRGGNTRVLRHSGIGFRVCLPVD